MEIQLRVRDKDDNPIARGVGIYKIFFNGMENVGGGDTFTYVAPDNSFVKVEIIDQQNNYLSYSNTFKVFDRDVLTSIFLLDKDCNEADPNTCCKASFLIVDERGSNAKYIYKTSSSKSSLDVYVDDVMVGSGDAVYIQDSLICKDVIVKTKTTYDGSCCCGNDVNGVCSDEETIEVLYQKLCPSISYSISSDTCITKLTPFIDFLTESYYSKSVDNYVVNSNMKLNILPIYGREIQYFYDNLLQTELLDEETIVTYKVTRIVDEGEDVVLLDNNIVIEAGLDEAGWLALQDSFIIDFDADTIGKYKIELLISNSYGVKSIEKIIYARDAIQVFISEDCNKYQVYNCVSPINFKLEKLNSSDSTFTIIYHVDEDVDGIINDLVNSSENGWNIAKGANGIYNLIHGNTDEDGVYKLTITSPTQTLVYTLVHFCNIKKCYASLVSELMCNRSEEKKLTKNELDRIRQRLNEFIILMMPFFQYYTKYSPVSIHYTPLANSDIEKLVAHLKLIERFNFYCDGCQEEKATSTNNCGCS